MSSLDKTARLWDAATGALQTTLEGHTDNVTSCAFSGDGTRVVTASDDKTARLCDAKTGANMCTCIASAPILSVDFSSIGGTCLVIATGNEHHLIRIHSGTTYRDSEL